MANVMMCH